MPALLFLNSLGSTGTDDRSPSLPQAFVVIEGAVQQALASAIRL